VSPWIAAAQGSCSGNTTVHACPPGRRSSRKLPNLASASPKMTPPSVVARALIPTVAAALCGCHADGHSTIRATVRDSSGIEIVANAAPLGAEHLPWTLDTVPIVDLGAREDDPHEQFSGVVIPLRLSNGHIVVATSGTSELRFFDPTGTWLHTIGRSGEGPGEFRSLGWLALGPGDTLRTYDWNLRRLSVISPAGKFVRSFDLASPGPRRGAIPLAVLTGGTILAGSTPFVTPGTPSGVTRDTAPLLVYGEAGTPVDSFGEFPGSEALIQGTEKSVTVMHCPFGKDLAVATVSGTSTIYVGSEDSPEVTIWSPAGLLTRIVRWHATAVPVTEHDRAAYVQAMEERAHPGQEEFQKRLVQMVREAPLPAQKPAYAGLVVGPRGTLWVQAYTAPEPDLPTPYQIFDSTGQWLGAITLPSRFKASQIGDDFVLGIWKDADDVDHVRLYRLSNRHPS